MTFTLSDLNEALIPFRKVLTFNATLPTDGFTLEVAKDGVMFIAWQSGLGADSGLDDPAWFEDQTSPSLLLRVTFNLFDSGANDCPCWAFLT